MTRRLTLALIGAVAAALLLAGFGTLLLAGLGDRRDARARLETQADDAADLIGFLGARAPSAVPAIRRSLQVDGVVVASFDRPGARETWLPAGVRLTSNDIARLRSGRPVSWTQGAHLSAAALVPQRSQVVVVSTDAPLFTRARLRWLGLASFITLTLAAGAGLVLARRITRPLRDLERATRRIAEGDLDAKVVVADGGDELADLGRSVNEMSAALGRAREHERNFLLSISHDLRTPLTSIRGWAEAIVDGTAEEPERAAGIILGESRRLERLVADLLQLAHLDGSQFVLRPQDVDVGDVVARAVDAFRVAFEDAGVALTVTVPDAPLPGRFDRDRLSQVVANLLENALKHAESSVRVSVDGASDGGQRVMVADDGAGIPVQDFERVFERLYAGQRTVRRAVGTGLGLAIVADLVAAMGGTVRCSSTPGGGTTMTLDLPRTPTPQLTIPRSS